MALVVDAMPDLGVTRISRWIFNCYVIDNGDGGAVVVDAGLPTMANDLAPILERLSGRLQAIVATHGHSDHLGGAPELAKRYGAPIYLPATTLTYLDGTRPRTPTLGDTARIWPTLIDQRLDPKAVVGLITGTRVAGFGTAAGMRWTGPPPAGGRSPTANGCPAPPRGPWCPHPDTPTTPSHSGTLPPGHCCPGTPSSAPADEPGTHPKPLTPPVPTAPVTDSSAWRSPTCCPGTAARSTPTRPSGNTNAVDDNPSASSKAVSLAHRPMPCGLIWKSLAISARLRCLLTYWS